MNIRFGAVPVSAIQKGVKLFDRDIQSQVTIADVYRETPDGSDHSGLFSMYVKVDDSRSWQKVAIEEGEQVARFDRVYV